MDKIRCTSSTLFLAAGVVLFGPRSSLDLACIRDTFDFIYEDLYRAVNSPVCRHSKIHIYYLNVITP